MAPPTPVTPPLLTLPPLAGTPPPSVPPVCPGDRPGLELQAMAEANNPVSNHERSRVDFTWVSFARDCDGAQAAQEELPGCAHVGNAWSLVLAFERVMVLGEKPKPLPRQGCRAWWCDLCQKTNTAGNRERFSRVARGRVRGL
jgi:hypothetical protein